MKIGIVTQPLWGNYGGILQNYALQQVLREMGHDPVTLDFMWGNTGIPYLLSSAKRILSRLAGGGQASWLIPYAPGRTLPEVIEFVDTCVSHTQTFWNGYSPWLIDRYGLEALIVGSDQVWRPKYSQAIEEMFLSFAEGRDVARVAYAASFGTSEWEFSPTQERVCSRLLAKFDAVSVREEDGIPLARRLGAEATVVQDPTLMLGREGFDRLLGPGAADTAGDPSLGVYILDPDPAMDRAVETIARSMGGLRTVKMKEETHGIGPREWISAIKNARYVLCDSFHGTIFCLLYHVPFISIVNEKRGGLSRFISLLRPLGLMDRLADSRDFVRMTTLDSLPPIDWATVDRVLAEGREHSRRFLRESLTTPRRR